MGPAARSPLLLLLVLAACGGGGGAPAGGQGPAPVADPSTLVGQFASLSLGLPELPGLTRRLQPVDVDGDGDLDLVALHGGTASLLRNDGGATFTAEPGQLPDVPAEDIAFGDLDADGDVDAVVAANLTRLWRNDGSGRFTDRTAEDLAGSTTETTRVALADLDGDLDLDLFVGKQSQRPRFYRNDGTGRFIDATLAFLPNVPRLVNSVVLRDFDGDGDVDVFLDGNVLWRNIGNTHLVDSTAGDVPPGAYVRAIAVDVDGDGDLDLMQTTDWYSSTPNQLLRNDGTGRFADVTASALPASFGREVACLAAADVDGDGDQDVLIGSQELLLRNDGAGSFQVASGMPPVQECIADCALADLDGDGDPDAVYAATTIVLEPCATVPRDRLLLNSGTGAFLQFNGPGAPARLPAGLAVDFDADGAPELISGTGEVWGNDGTGAFTIRQTLPHGGAPAVRPASADVDGDGDIDVFVGGQLYLQGPAGTFTPGPLGVPAARAACWFDADADGDADLVVGTGQSAPVPLGGQTRLFRNDGAGNFTETTAGAMPLDDDLTTSIAAADVDGDGDLDLALTSSGPTAADRLRRLYRNDGAGHFVDDSATLPTDRGGDATVGFVDADGDGDADLVFDGGDRCLWHNDGSGAFTATTERDPWCGAPLWLDLDEDGDIDLLRRSFTTVTAWFHDGHGVFTADGSFELPSFGEIPFQPVPLPVDVDADGDIDLLFENQGVLLRNRTRQLSAPMPPRLGRPFHLLVASRPGVLPRTQTAMVWTSPTARATVLELAPHGLFLLGDLGLTLLGTVAVPALVGEADLVVPVPAQPALAGLPVHAQAALFDPVVVARFTNRIATVVQP